MEKQVYKSRDITYMRKLQQAVVNAQADKNLDERLLVWEDVKNQIVLEDLEAYAIGSLNRPLHFSKENFDADIMVIFQAPPTKEEIQLIQKMLTNWNTSDNIYITSYEKTPIQEASDSQVLTSVLQSEIVVLKPKIILSFGVPIGAQIDWHVPTDYREAKLLITSELDSITKGPDELIVEHKKNLWNEVKELMQYYNL